MTDFDNHHTLHTLPVLTSMEKVIDRCRLVFFHPDRVGPAVANWGHLLDDYSSWERSIHYFDGTRRTVQWIFVLDTLNHCFWPDEGKPVWEIVYGETPQSGYYGLAACLKRAMEEGIPITDARYLADLSADDLIRVFAGTGEIPLFDERLANLREAGQILLARWGGEAAAMVESAQGSAVKLVRLVTETFSSFRDQALYDGNMIYFWKRAQIFAADLHMAFNGRDWGSFTDMEELTAFADYKLPQVLRELGIISYDPDLAGKVDRKEHITSGSTEEIEIRAMTIWAVEALRAAFLQTGIRALGMHVDNWLWRLGQLDTFRGKPYPRCRTIFY